MVSKLEVKDMSVWKKRKEQLVQRGRSSCVHHSTVDVMLVGLQEL